MFVDVVGDAADEVVTETEREIGIGLTRDASTGRLTSSFVGPAVPGTIEDKMLSALRDPCVTVRLEATNTSNTYTTSAGRKGAFSVAVYLGTTEQSDGSLVASQKVNMTAAHHLESVGGPTKGRIVLHEAVEAYTGAQLFGAHAGDSPSGSHYTTSHISAIVIDPVYQSALENIQIVERVYRDEGGTVVKRESVVKNVDDSSKSKVIITIDRKSGKITGTPR